MLRHRRVPRVPRRPIIVTVVLVVAAVVIAAIGVTISWFRFVALAMVGVAVIVPSQGSHSP